MIISFLNRNQYYTRRDNMKSKEEIFLDLADIIQLEDNKKQKLQSLKYMKF
jgi:hypothetical protein